MSCQKSQSNYVASIFNEHIRVGFAAPNAFRQMHSSRIVSLDRAFFDSAIRTPPRINQQLSAFASGKAGVMNKELSKRGKLEWKRRSQFRHIEVVFPS